jgi:hypothetical protein
MRQIRPFAQMLFSLVVASLTTGGHAQSATTASQQLQLSAFAAGTGTFTGYEGGKNLAITAGADLTYLPLRLLRPSIEIRGSYPINEGTISSQKDLLAGVRVEHSFGRLRPYADFLVGRGQIDYGMGGVPVGTLLYLSSTSTVYSPGGGLDYDLSHHFAFKADAQFQRWNSPVVPSGIIHPVSASFGVIYRFDFNPHHHRSR